MNRLRSQHMQHPTLSWGKFPFLQISLTPGHYLVSWRDKDLIRKNTGVLKKSRKGCCCLLFNHPDPACTHSQGYPLISNQFWNDLPTREVNNLAAAFIDSAKIAYCAERNITWVNSIKKNVQEPRLPVPLLTPTTTIHCYHCSSFSKSSVPDITYNNSAKTIHIAVLLLLKSCIPL